MSTLSVRLDQDRLGQIQELAETHPALSQHAVGRVAIRLGLRVLVARPSRLLAELAAMARERKIARAARAQAEEPTPIGDDVADFTTDEDAGDDPEDSHV